MGGPEFGIFGGGIQKRGKFSKGGGKLKSNYGTNVKWP